MSRNWTRTTITVGCLVAAGGLTVGVTPSNAALTTRCVGEAGAVTVPGDLVVPAGESCSLTGTVILGAVRVGPGADLLLNRARVDGAVAVRADGYLDAVDSSVNGAVRAREAFGVFLDASSLGSGYSGRGTGGSFTGGFFFGRDSSVAGDLDTRDGEVYLAGSTVRGSLISAGSTSTDVLDSTLTGDITVTKSSAGAVFCASEVDGDALYQGNTGTVQLGNNGPQAGCDGGSYWGGDVSVVDNTGAVLFSGNIVRGDLSGTGNDPAPTGENNRLRGAVTGQFVDLQPTPADASAEAGLLSVAPQHGEAELANEREQRRTAAVAEAGKAGPADL